MKISFNNDYSQIAHQQVLMALNRFKNQAFKGYGLDEISLKVQANIKKLINNQKAEVYFLVGGTQTNLTFIASVLSPTEAVIAVDSAHINVHETGAIEATGHKIITTSANDGKINIKEINKVLKEHSDEHMVKPKLVFISNATELGTIYTKNELKELYQFCQKNGLLLFIDGARLANALTASNNDVEVKDLSKLCDAFYFGGTKNGLLFGEALVINNQSLAKDFRYIIKQRGGLLAKGFLLGIQFEAYFKNDLYLKLAKHANKLGQKLKDHLIKNHYHLFSGSTTNQIFFKLSNQKIKALEKKYVFSVWSKVDQANSIVRFVTSFANTESEVKQLIKDL